jgi:hypothetical protein
MLNYTLICKFFPLCCSSSPSNCIDEFCLKAKSWYWLGKAGDQIPLSADHLEFMGQMNVDGQSNCIKLKDTNYFDIGCKQQKQSVCEVEGSVTAVCPAPPAVLNGAALSFSSQLTARTATISRWVSMGSRKPFDKLY